MIRAGELRTPVTIQRRSTGGGALGGGAVEWSDVGAIRIKLADAGGSESVGGLQLRGAITHVATARYRRDLTARMRLVKRDGTVLNVVWVDDVNDRHEELRMGVAEAS